MIHYALMTDKTNHTDSFVARLVYIGYLPLASKVLNKGIVPCHISMDATLHIFIEIST